MASLYYLLLVLFCVHAECRLDEQFFEETRDYWDQRLRVDVDMALKHKYGDSFGGTDDDTCARNCIVAPPQALVENMSSEFPDIMNSITRDILTLLCRYANSAATCVRTCPATQRLLFLRELSAPIKYICEESHIIDHIECYKEVWDLEKERCFSENECGPKKAAFTSQTQRSGITSKSDSEAAVGSLCTFVDCVIKCGKAKLVEKCKMERNSELVGLLKKVGESMNAMRYFESAYVIDIPDRCNHIGQNEKDYIS